MAPEDSLERWYFSFKFFLHCAFFSIRSVSLSWTGLFLSAKSKGGTGGGDRHAGWQQFLRLCRILLPITAAGFLAAADLSDPTAAAEPVCLVSDDLRTECAVGQSGDRYSLAAGLGGRRGRRVDLPFYPVGLDVD